MISRYLEDIKQLFKPLNLHFGKRWFVMPRTFTILPDNYLIISVSFDAFLILLELLSSIGPSNLSSVLKLLHLFFFLDFPG